jgi:hypothetical protein
MQISDKNLAEFNLNMMKSWSGVKNDTSVGELTGIKGEKRSLGGK